MEVRHGEDVSHLEYEGVRFVDVVALVEPPLGVEGQGVLAPQIGATLQVEERVGNLDTFLQRYFIALKDVTDPRASGDKSGGPLTVDDDVVADRGPHIKWNWAGQSQKGVGD